MGLFGALTNPSTLAGLGLIGASFATGGAAAPALLGAGIGTSLGGIQGSMAKDAAKKQRAAAIEGEAIKSKYAPFTGQQGDISGAAATPIPDVFSKALSGGLTGLALSRDFKGSADTKSPTSKAALPASSKAASTKSSGGTFSNLVPSGVSAEGTSLGAGSMTNAQGISTDQYGNPVNQTLDNNVFLRSLFGRK